MHSIVDMSENRGAAVSAPERRDHVKKGVPPAPNAKQSLSHVSYITDICELDSRVPCHDRTHTTLV